MSDEHQQDQDRLANIEAELRQIRRSQTTLIKRVDSMKETIDRAKGGLKIILGVGVILGTVVGWFISWFKPH